MDGLVEREARNDSRLFFRIEEGSLQLEPRLDPLDHKANRRRLVSVAAHLH